MQSGSRTKPTKAAARTINTSALEAATGGLALLPALGTRSSPKQRKAFHHARFHAKKAARPAPTITQGAKDSAEVIELGWILLDAGEQALR